ncbi:MAG: hypothetical protein DWQ09_05765 [Proteobacteria bacterium]|nr:MAG: hypothetical protein DWQ09_05765 [Pseudomonadota bacterium]QKK11450.1 MAG: hypothetical protein HND59_07455 [Pseudomonadota bacterium]
MSEPEVPAWGIMPEQAAALARKRYWDNRPVLKALMTGERGFPLHIPLKSPNARQPLENLAHLRDWIEVWKKFTLPDLLHWKTVSFRQLGQQRLPARITIGNFQQLTQLCGPSANAQSARWRTNMQPLLQRYRQEQVYPVLVRHIEIVEGLGQADAELLARVLPQLRRGLGAGGYLRALPLQGVDTKFVENCSGLIEALLDAVHNGEIAASGGLNPWLGCLPGPRGLAQGVPVVRPLSPGIRHAFQGLPLFQLSADLLRQHELPATNILVVENLQSGLALPDLDDTIAVIGGGRNVSWMNASWLTAKRVGYWGDIDSWGLSILSDARASLASVEPLMMDVATLNAHEERMVQEPEPLSTLPAQLTGQEQQLFLDLAAGRFLSTRLEQERISSDFVSTALETWLFS